MRVLIMGVLLLVASPAWGEWVRVSTNANSVVFYVDPATIKKDGHLRRYWEVHDLSLRDKDGDLSYRFFVEADCKERRLRPLQQDFFRGPMGKGERTGGVSQPTEGHYVAPGTSDEDVLAFVCDR